MNANPVLYVKLALVAVVIVGIFVLAGLGRIDANTAIGSVTAAVGALVIALGIRDAGSTIAKGSPPPSPSGGSAPPAP